MVSIHRRCSILRPDQFVVGFSLLLNTKELTVLRAFCCSPSEPGISVCITLYYKVAADNFYHVSSASMPKLLHSAINIKYVTLCA